jgi:glutathionylspermidine synthase
VTQTPSPPPFTIAASQPGLVLPAAAQPYDLLADRLLAEGVISDPWSCGLPRFYNAPLRAHPQWLARLYHVAAQIGYVFECASQIVWGDPSLLDNFYALMPFQKLMWLSSGGHWHGFARLDAFICADGSIQVCEINADTPSGQVDAAAVSALLLSPDLTDPNAPYEAALWDAICHAHSACSPSAVPDPPRSIGILFPTEMPEDLSLIQLYRRWFEARGCRVTLGSPFNLSPTPDGGVALFGTPIDFAFRHYKTDWWGERWPVWADAPPFEDPDPLADQLQWLIEAEHRGRVTVFNPFGAIIPQNKLTMALCWEHIDRFPPSAQATIRAHIPPTFRLDALDRASLLSQRSQWVLKSDYGCEGDEVVIGPLVSDDTWQRALDLAIDGCWIVQSYFHIQPLGPWWPNHGVYLIGGQPKGILTRLSPLSTLTDVTAQVIPVFIDPSAPPP